MRLWSSTQWKVSFATSTGTTTTTTATATTSTTTITGCFLILQLPMIKEQVQVKGDFTYVDKFGMNLIYEYQGKLRLDLKRVKKWWSGF